MHGWLLRSHDQEAEATIHHSPSLQDDTLTQEEYAAAEKLLQLLPVKAVTNLTCAMQIKVTMMFPCVRLLTLIIIAGGSLTSFF